MAIYWVGSSAQGAGDGSSFANRALWTNLDTAITAAAGGSSPFEVRIASTDSYTYTGSGITVSTGGSSLANRVKVFGCNSSGTASLVRIISDRSDPYVEPDPNSYDQWAPTGGGSVGSTVFKPSAGAANLWFTMLEFRRCGYVFDFQDPLTNIDFTDIVGTNIRKLINMGSGGPGLQGTQANPITIARIQVNGHSKNALHFRRAAWVNFTDIVLDSQNQDYDFNAAGISFGGNSQNDSSHDITITRLISKNCRTTIYTNNGVDTYTIVGTPTGGTFTLTYNSVTSTPIAYNAVNGVVRSSLAIGGLVTGDIFAAGALGGTLTLRLGWHTLPAPGPATNITADFSGLTGGTYTLTKTQSWAAMTAGYFQGDGITTEEFDTRIKIIGFMSSGHADGGMDSKSSATYLWNCTFSGCKRNFRQHQNNFDNGGNVLINCTAKEPRIPVYANGTPLAGQASLGQLSNFEASGGPLHLINPTIVDTAGPDSATSQMYRAESGDQWTTYIQVMGGSVTRKTGSLLTFTTGGTKVDIMGGSDTVV